jgi:integrase
MNRPYWIRARDNGIFYVMFATQPGKWRSTGQRDESSALRWIVNHLEEKRAIPITLKDFTKDFFIPDRCKWVRRKRAKGRTFGAPHLRRCRAILDGYILPRFGSFLISTITRRQIDDWLLDLVDKKSGASLAGATRNKILSVFRSVLDEAADMGIVEYNAAKGVRPFDATPVEREVFSPEELLTLFPADIDRLKAIWLTLEWAAYFMIQGTCGLRPGEVAALRWGRWYQNLHGLIVDAAVENETGRIKSTKTRNTKPAVLTSMCEQLLTLLKYQAEDSSKDAFIFPRGSKSPYHLETANKHFKASCERAGIDRRDRVQYCLRHSFNTHMLRLLSMADVQQLMGHASDKMTRHYNHPTAESLLEGVQRARDAIGKFWANDVLPAPSE